MTNITIQGESLTREKIEELFEKGKVFHRESMLEKEERENNPPECPNSCEMKEKLLSSDTLKDSFTPFIEEGYAQEEYQDDIENINYYLFHSNISILLEEKRLEIINVRDEIIKLELTIEDYKKKEKTLENQIIALIPIQEDFLREIMTHGN